MTRHKVAVIAVWDVSCYVACSSARAEARTAPREQLFVLPSRTLWLALGMFRLELLE